MSYKLQNLNVIKLVESEADRDRLKAKGFTDITPVENTTKTTTVDYNNYTLDDLKQLAKDKNIQGYSSMNKGDLVAALNALEGTDNK